MTTTSINSGSGLLKEKISIKFDFVLFFPVSVFPAALLYCVTSATDISELLLPIWEIGERERQRGRERVMCTNYIFIGGTSERIKI